jgi:hypothetical protein
MQLYDILQEMELNGVGLMAKSGKAECLLDVLTEPALWAQMPSVPRFPSNSAIFELRPSCPYSK